jgi:hypothetical protein
MRNLTRPRWTQCQLLLCLTLFSISTVSLTQERLSASEMRSALSGNTLYGKTERGSDFRVYHSLEGKMSGQARLAYYDVGEWDVTEDGNYCRQWTNWREGARDCFDMYRTGDNQFRINAINYHYESTFRVREGDPESLKGRI